MIIRLSNLLVLSVPNEGVDHYRHNFFYTSQSMTGECTRRSQALTWLACGRYMYWILNYDFYSTRPENKMLKLKVKTKSTNRLNIPNKQCNKNTTAKDQERLQNI